MDISVPAIVCGVRAQGETACVARLFTEEHGLVAVYVAGGRGRQLRPVLIAGNAVMAELRTRSDSRLPFARLELLTSRAPFLAEPVPAAAIDWVTALTAASLPQWLAFPAFYAALSGLLDAICHAPSARGWVPGLVAFEALLLREAGYGEMPDLPGRDDLAANLTMLDRLGPLLARYALAESGGDVMAARAVLRERLERIR